MPGIDDSLQKALGPGITLERSLGGGMSRVFLARDTTLERQVVVKVLAGGADGGVNLERFMREIRLLAQLQHPHIVPVLSVGEVDGMPFYVMPYLDGDSLAHKLSREGELPVATVEQVLRELLDALVYAHGERIVHRDIKPANVLMAGGHAVLTDFGIARALATATSDHRLTTTGMALGTPAYMAPEQIAAEPTVDHRADLYALGAMAFELLTGTPPFAAASTQALFLQHLSQPAPPVTTRRPGVPLYLQQFIARCLEKSPADRYQSASEALAALGSAARTPVEVAAVDVSAVRPPARPLALAMVRAAAAMVIALGLTAVSIRVFALPDWVFRAALGVAVMVLVLAFVANRYERAHASAPASGAPPITRTRVRRTGVAAFAALGVGAALFMASRATGIGPGATLLSAGTLAPRDRLVVADVAGAANDTVVTAVSQLLRIALAQSTAISILDGERLSSALARMQRPPAAAVTADVAQELATRLGLKAFVTSTLVRAGGGWVLAASVVRTSDREPLLQVRETITSPSELIGGVDRLAAQLRERIGESLRAVRADKPLEDITTKSLTALQFYAEAQLVANRSGTDEAVALLDRAIAIDSSFAMAWRQKGAYLGNYRETVSRAAAADTALHRAYALRDNLPTRERLLVEATVVSESGNRLGEVVGIYRSLLTQYPDDPIASNNLAAMLQRLGSTREAIAVVRKALRDGSASSLTYSNALLAVSRGGDSALADSIQREFASAYPTAGDRFSSLAVLAGDRGDARLLDSLAARAASYPLSAQLPLRAAQASLAAQHGRLADADRLLRDAIGMRARVSAASEPERALEFAVARTGFALDALSDTTAPLTLLRAAWRTYAAELGSRPPTFRAANLTARLLAQLGQPAEARAIIAPIVARANTAGYAGVGQRASAYITLGSIAAAAGDPAGAIRTFREACEPVRELSEVCAQGALIEQAEAHAQAGRPDSAIAGYRRFVGITTGRWVGAPGTIDLAAPRVAGAWRRLGTLLDAAGDTTGALEAYARFVALWKDADAPLQPMVRRVSARMIALRGPRRTGG